MELRLRYDEDVDDSVKVKDVLDFLQEMDKVQSDTDAPSPLEFNLGSDQFKGVVEGYTFQPTRFDASCRMTGLELFLSMTEVRDD